MRAFAIGDPANLALASSDACPRFPLAHCVLSDSGPYSRKMQQRETAGTCSTITVRLCLAKRASQRDWAGRQNVRYGDRIFRHIRSLRSSAHQKLSKERPLVSLWQKSQSAKSSFLVNSRQSEGTPIATGRRRSWPSVDCDDDGHPSANLGRGAHLLILRSSASYRWTDAFGRYRLQPPTDICRPAAVLQPTEWNTGSS